DQSLRLAGADGRVEHLRLDVAEGPRAPRTERLVDGVAVVRVAVELPLIRRAHPPEGVDLRVEIDVDPGHRRPVRPETDGALQLDDVGLGDVVLRRKDVDAEPDAQLVEPEVESLQPVPEEAARRDASVAVEWRHASRPAPGRLRYVAPCSMSSQT